MGILNTISLDSLSRAYNLDINQCVQLAQRVSCWSAEGEPFSADKMSTLGKAAILDDYSIESFPNRAIDTIRNAAMIWHDGTTAASIEIGIQEYESLMNAGQQELATTALRFIIDTFFIDIGTFLVDKEQAVHLLYENSLALINEVQGLTKDSVDKILASKTVARSESPQPIESPLPATAVPQKGDGAASVLPISPITSAAWERAIDKYEEKYLARKNDALPKRMKVLLRLLANEFYSTAAEDRPDLSRDCKKAYEEDVPRLKQIFPELPDLPKIHQN